MWRAYVRVRSYSLIHIKPISLHILVMEKKSASLSSIHPSPHTRREYTLGEDIHTELRTEEHTYEHTHYGTYARRKI